MQVYSDRRVIPPVQDDHWSRSSHHFENQKVPKARLKEESKKYKRWKFLSSEEPTNGDS